MTYTHGLEKIYAFETINPATVRAVGGQTKAQEIQKNPYISGYRTTDLPLPLGPYFEEGLPSFKLKEPIASLELTPFALKALNAKEIKTVEEAYSFINDEANHKNFGKSHIDEIGQKIERYLGKYPKAIQATVDFKSLITILTYELENKERYLLLSRFGLGWMTSLVPTELQEINRLNFDQIEQTIMRAKNAILQRHTPFLQTALREIQEAFIFPWLRHRHGFAKQSEVLARLQNVSVEPDHFATMLSLLQELAPEFIAEPVIASDQAVHEQYQAVLRLAKSYFYQPECSYPVAKLVSLIERDLIRQGLANEPAFIERVLKSAPCFSCFFDSSHTLFVTCRTEYRGQNVYVST